YGYVWLSTENGIVRYDGRNFKIFNGNNRKDFSDSRMLYFDGNIKEDSIFVHNVQGEKFLIHKHAILKGDGGVFKDFVKLEVQKSYGNRVEHLDRNTEIGYKGVTRFL